MKKIWFLLLLIIIPVFAYEVYTPSDYSYKDNGDKLLFVVDYSNSMGEFLEHKTKANQVKEMMNYILPQISDLEFTVIHAIFSRIMHAEVLSL